MPSDRRGVWTQGAIFVVLGMSPDFDLLVGQHRAETHSVGAALMVAGLAVMGRWPVAAAGWRTAAAAGVAWGSHVLLDIIGADSSPPFGAMAAWPVSEAYVHLASLFPSVDRRWWLPGFLMANLWAVSVELTVLGPVAWAVWRWRRGREAWPGRRSTPSAAHEQAGDGARTEQVAEPNEDQGPGTKEFLTPGVRRHAHDQSAVGRPRRGGDTRERGPGGQPPREVDFGG